jgi:hypothetical protein
MPLSYHSAAIRPREHDERVGPGGAQRLSHGGRVAVMAGEADMSDLLQRHFEARRIA